MKKIIVVLFAVILLGGFVFAETKQFYTISNFGGYGISIVKIGDQSSTGNSSSLGFGFSSGWEDEDYVFAINVGMGLDRTTASISYSYFFKNALFAAAEALVSSPYDYDNHGYAYTVGGAFGLSFTGVGKSWLNVGLALSYSHQSIPTINASMSMMEIGLIIDELFPVSDSLSMFLGMTLGGIPLFVTLKDKQSGDSVSLSVTELNISLRTGIKYSFPMELSTTPRLRTH